MYHKKPTLLKPHDKQTGISSSITSMFELFQASMYKNYAFELYTFYPPFWHYLNEMIQYFS